MGGIGRRVEGEKGGGKESGGNRPIKTSSKKEEKEMQILV